MTDPSAEGRAEGFDHDLRDLIDDQRRLEAVERRRRGHWLAQEAGEAGTLAGVLVDLGERAQTVVLTTTPGRRLAGRIRRVGHDVVVLATTSGPTALVAVAALSAVRPEPGERPPVGDRRVAAAADLRDLLLEQVPQRPRVVIHTQGGDGLAGDLRVVGTDVVTLWQAAEGAAAHVPLAAIGDVLLP